MKVRLGFVSNSSSSSFVCDVTGYIESGRDMDLSEANMSQCNGGHTFYNKYLLDYDKEKVWQEHHEELVKSCQEKVDKEIWKTYENRDDYWGCNFNEKYFRDQLEEALEDEYDEDWEPEDMVPTEACPICQMEKFKGEDLLKFVMLEFDYTKEKLQDMFKNAFTSYDAFKEIWNENKDRLCK